jgi:hypothetical protein
LKQEEIKRQQEFKKRCLYCLLGAVVIGACIVIGAKYYYSPLATLDSPHEPQQINVNVDQEPSDEEPTNPQPPDPSSQLVSPKPVAKADSNAKEDVSVYIDRGEFVIPCAQPDRRLLRAMDEQMIRANQLRNATHAL